MDAIKSVGKVKTGTKNKKLKITGKTVKSNFLSFVGLPFHRDTAGNTIKYISKGAEKKNCSGEAQHLGGLKVRVLCYVLPLR